MVGQREADSSVNNSSPSLIARNEQHSSARSPAAPRALIRGETLTARMIFSPAIYQCEARFTLLLLE